MDKDKFYNWEAMSLNGIIWLMIKWFNFDSVTMEVRRRDSVESRVWYEIKIEWGKAKLMYINGQRADIVKTRLIEFLDREGIRADYKNERSGK